MSVELVSMFMNAVTYSDHNQSTKLSVKTKVLNGKLDYFHCEMTIEKIDIEAEFHKDLVYDDFKFEMDKILLREVTKKLKQ